MDERWSLNNAGESLAATVSALLSASLTALLQIHEFLPQLSFSGHPIAPLTLVFVACLCLSPSPGHEPHWRAQRHNLIGDACGASHRQEGHTEPKQRGAEDEPKPTSTKASGKFPETRKSRSSLRSRDYIGNQ